MTNQKLIEKLLKHGYVKCDNDTYTKQVGSTTVKVTICQYNTMVAAPDASKFFLPSLEEIGPWGENKECTWGADSLNITMAKRGYFK